MRYPIAAILILDGVGATKDYNGNAVTKAFTPFLKRTWSAYPHGYLLASEEEVGLPKGVRGNSEVGHMNIGAGKIVYQSLLRINKSIALGTFSSNKVIQEAINHAVKNHSRIHIIGLISDGGTHAHLNHAIEILKIIKMQVPSQQVFIHAFTDGRDSEPKTAKEYIGQVDATCQKLQIGTIATIVGRYYAMDRDERWDRTQIAYDLLTQGKGTFNNTWQEAIDHAYNVDKSPTDEFIKPHIVNKEGIIRSNDTIIFINFRSDRAIQITKAFIDPTFDRFAKQQLTNIFFASMMSYSKDLEQYTHVIFPRNIISLPIGRVLSEYNIRQVRIAESTKYPHVTYFFNGGNNIIFSGEHRETYPSPRDVPTFDKKPEMSAYEITDKIEKLVDSNNYQFFVINLANGDMVGHTGVLEAGIKAMETVDKCAERITQKILSKGGIVFITADHGNVEEMINKETGEIDTEHSLNPVPFMIVASNLNKRIQLPLGKLADIAPTVLHILGIRIPSEMSGDILYKEKI